MSSSQKRAIVLQHIVFEGPARLASLLEARAYQLDIRRLDRGDAVPERLAKDELLIVMGGPMGVADAERAEYPFLQRELALLQRCVEEDAPVLGVCLGAQLIAAAAGARVYPLLDEHGARVREVGWGQIALHASSTDDPILADLPAQTQVLHWHGDTFDLPQQARLLASTSRCRNQAFQLRTRLFGLQFHCEVDAQQVHEFLRADADFVKLALGDDGAQQIARDTEACADQAWSVGQRLLGNMLDLMETKA